MDWMQIVVAIVAFVYLIYRWGTKNYDFWKKKGVKQTKPWPFLGDHGAVLIQKKSSTQFMTDMYNTHPNCRFFGAYFFTKPCLMVRDPDFLKQVLVKDADHFLNRFNWTENTDPLMSKNLSLLTGERWRAMRTVMSTAFTGAKMKDMFKFMEKCGTQAADNMEVRLKDQMSSKSLDANVLELDMKDFFSRYGTDVIATTAFGLEVDSFKNPTNEFYSIGEIMREKFKKFPVFRMLFMSTFPRIAKAFNMTFMGSRINNFFINIIEETVRARTEHNIIRKDVIHVLMEARKGKGLGEGDEEFSKGKIPDLTEADIAAQSMSFFFGGFDIMATALGFACYELAGNLKIQEQLYEEISQVVENENGITYEGVMYQMTYLDMVVKETLRKWPPAVMTDREVTKTYVIPKGEDSPEVTLNKGDMIMVPIYGIHRDPQYYPNPDNFDPERFRDEKNTIKPLTYLPFGAGLRHCVAIRYAMMEIKVALVCLLMKFFIVPTEKTTFPLKAGPGNGFMLVPENGYSMGLKHRA